MADRISLEIVGFILGGVTAIVVAIAVLVVRANVEGHYVLDQSRPVVPISLQVKQ